MSRPYATDHDLLISLHEKVDALTTKVDAGLLDHEKRVRKLEKASSVYKGAIGVLIFLAGLIEPLFMFFKGNGK